MIVHLSDRSKMQVSDDVCTFLMTNDILRCLIASLLQYQYNDY